MTTVMTHKTGVHEMGPAVIAIGVFDGVHLGHQTLISDAIKIARDRRIMSCVLTFDRDPDQVVTPQDAAPQLTTFEDKIALIRTVGPDAILVVPFDEWLASLTPADFCIDVLLDAAEPVACIVGYDFRFGHRASGDVHTLHELGDLHGFDVITHPLVRVGEAPITSTRIRGLVTAGKVAEAASLLGRQHRLRGTVVHGKRIGHELGTPTANVEVDARFAVPAAGVYAAWGTVGERRYPAAVSVGTPPMFPDSACSLEAHLIGFEGDIYEAELMVEFADRLRDLEVFPSVQALASAITADIARVRMLLGV